MKWSAGLSFVIEGPGADQLKFLDDEVERAWIESVFDLFDHQQWWRFGMTETGQKRCNPQCARRE